MWILGDLSYVEFLKSIEYKLEITHPLSNQIYTSILVFLSSVLRLLQGIGEIGDPLATETLKFVNPDFVGHCVGTCCGVATTTLSTLLELTYITLCWSFAECGIANYIENFLGAVGCGTQ